MMVRTAVHLFLAGALCAGCVTTSTHEHALADLNKQHQDNLAQAKAQDEADKARAADLEKKLAETQQRVDDLTRLLQGATADKDKLDKLLRATSSELDSLSSKKAAA